jgi:hypothetical protein
VILLISAFWVARIIGVSHWSLAVFFNNHNFQLSEASTDS